MNTLELDKFTKEIDEIFIDLHKTQKTGFYNFYPYLRDFKKSLEITHEDICCENSVANTIYEVESMEHFDFQLFDILYGEESCFYCSFYVYEKDRKDDEFLECRNLRYRFYPECL